MELNSGIDVACGRRLGDCLPYVQLLCKPLTVICDSWPDWVKRCAAYFITPDYILTSCNETPAHRFNSKVRGYVRVLGTLFFQGNLWSPRMKMQLILMHLALALQNSHPDMLAFVEHTSPDQGQGRGQNKAQRPKHLTEPVDMLKKIILFILLPLISDAFQVSFSTEKVWLGFTG